ncbi:MAG: TIGR03619 family F420-dependent LLM class oxidoreductase [Novosphingobium sp.]|nr:TIGR03619 family F420-dependent LLM class oxidoreductase [Novosphingobium sp.]
MKATYNMTLEQLVVDRPDLASDKLRIVAQAAEAAGFDACNLTDHPFPDATWLANAGHNAFDPMAALCFVAGFTTRIMLHTNIVVLPYRNPFLTAKEVTTLDVLSKGRAIMGIGVGYQATEFEALGVNFAQRGKLMDEAIDAMKAAWTGDVVQFEGLNFNATNNRQFPAPLQKPHPPIWCGGNGKIAMRRAAVRCDGWTPFFLPPGPVGARHPDAISTVADLKERVAEIGAMREEAGRTGRFDIAPSSPVPVNARTREVADRFLTNAAELADAGATWVGLGLPGVETSEMIENLTWFGEEVLPQLHALG